VTEDPCSVPQLSEPDDKVADPSSNTVMIGVEGLMDCGVGAEGKLFRDNATKIMATVTMTSTAFLVVWSAFFGMYTQQVNILFREKEGKVAYL